MSAADVEYRVNTSRGEPGIRTNSLAEAERMAERWGAEVEVRREL